MKKKQQETFHKKGVFEKKTRNASKKGVLFFKKTLLFFEEVWKFCLEWWFQKKEQEKKVEKHTKNTGMKYFWKEKKTRERNRKKKDRKKQEKTRKEQGEKRKKQGEESEKEKEKEQFDQQQQNEWKLFPLQKRRFHFILILFLFFSSKEEKKHNPFKTKTQQKWFCFWCFISNEQQFDCKRKENQEIKNKNIKKQKEDEKW